VVGVEPEPASSPGDHRKARKEPDKLAQLSWRRACRLLAGRYTARQGSWKLNRYSGTLVSSLERG
jgi:hypothetical protein